MQLRQKSWVDLANDFVQISDVLTEIGVFVPATIKEGSNKKIHCPFGFYHSDGGLTKAMRVYTQSNTAYCFSCSKRYSPVSLLSAKLDCSWNSAAVQLLEDFGYKPKTLKERWQEATAEQLTVPDTLALADALKIYCDSLTPDWNQRQLDSNISDTLNKCLDLLRAVKTDADATKWLDTTKLVMKRKLIKESHNA